MEAGAMLPTPRTRGEAQKSPHARRIVSSIAVSLPDRQLLGTDHGMVCTSLGCFIVDPQLVSI